jgi:hypothetical protein
VKRCKPIVTASIALVAGATLATHAAAAGRTRFGPGPLEILASERQEFAYCTRQARKYPTRVTCGTKPDKVLESACKRHDKPQYATCSYVLSYVDGQKFSAPNQFFEKVGERWVLRSVIRIED